MEIQFHKKKMFYFSLCIQHSFELWSVCAICRLRSNVSWILLITTRAILHTSWRIVSWYPPRFSYQLPASMQTVYAHSHPTLFGCYGIRPEHREWSLTFRRCDNSCLILAVCRYHSMRIRGSFDLTMEHYAIKFLNCHSVSLCVTSSEMNVAVWRSWVPPWTRWVGRGLKLSLKPQLIQQSNNHPLP